MVGVQPCGANDEGEKSSSSRPVVSHFVLDGHVAGFVLEFFLHSPCWLAGEKSEGLCYYGVVCRLLGVDVWLHSGVCFGSDVLCLCVDLMGMIHCKISIML